MSKFLPEKLIDRGLDLFSQSSRQNHQYRSQISYQNYLFNSQQSRQAFIISLVKFGFVVFLICLAYIYIMTDKFKRPQLESNEIKKVEIKERDQIIIIDGEEAYVDSKGIVYFNKEGILANELLPSKAKNEEIILKSILDQKNYKGKERDQIIIIDGEETYVDSKGIIHKY